MRVSGLEAAWWAAFLHPDPGFFTLWWEEGWMEPVCVCQILGQRSGREEKWHSPINQCPSYRALDHAWFWERVIMIDRENYTWRNDLMQVFILWFSPTASCRPCNDTELLMAICNSDFGGYIPILHYKPNVCYLLFNINTLTEHY